MEITPQQTSIVAIVRQRLGRLHGLGLTPVYLVISRDGYDQLIGEVHLSGFISDTQHRVERMHDSASRCSCVVKILGLLIVVVNGPAELLDVVTNPVDQFFSGGERDAHELP